MAAAGAEEEEEKEEKAEDESISNVCFLELYCLNTAIRHLFIKMPHLSYRYSSPAPVTSDIQQLIRDNERQSALLHFLYTPYQCLLCFEYQYL